MQHLTGHPPRQPPAGGILRAPSSSSSSVRLCVTAADHEECLQMANVANGTIACVKARDR